MDDTAWDSDDDPEERQAELERKERDNLERIQKFLDKAKKQQKIFVQNGPCYQIDQKLPPCHECKKIWGGASYVLSGTCCCFEGFRKLRYTSHTKLTVVGYLDPSKDPKPNDIEIWTPNKDFLSEDVTDEVAFFIIKKIGDILCNMVYEEKLLHESFEAGGRQVV